MVNCLIVCTLSFLTSLNANYFSTTESAPRGTQQNISMTSFSHKNISMTSFSHKNISVTGNNSTHNNSGDTRVVGGTIIKPFSWPFLVRMHTFQRARSGKIVFRCGGAVYNESYILTAAHCLYNLTSEARSNLQVTAGEHSISLTEGHEQVRNVSMIIIHPGYDVDAKQGIVDGHILYKDLQHDIALLKLSSPLDLGTTYVTPIELNTANSCPAPRVMCSVAGYGKLKEDDSFLPDVPYEVRMPVMSSQECNLIKEENEIYEWYNFDHNICARDLRLGSDVCRGDSGGPFVCPCGGSNKHAGIVSWVVKCGSGLHPAVFTRTSCYVDWIKSGSEETTCGEGDSIYMPFDYPSLVNRSSLSVGNRMALLIIMYRCVLFMFTDHP